jgi:hypothetical protein
MKSIKWTMVAAVTTLFFNAPNVLAQAASSAPPPGVSSTDAQHANIRAYIELLRSDVKEKKTAILVELMQLNDDQAEKFWPIYHEYDSELQALNDRKLAGIQEYAKNYQNMTDEKANEIAMLALQLENQRNELKRKYYEKILDQLGGIIAARFLQIENQMLMVIDLQIASSLPIVEK